MPRRKQKIVHAAIVGLFAERLREVRSSRGLTQAELAREAHLTTSYIWRLESGRTAPGIDLVDRLAKALGTTIAELLPTSPSPDTLTLLQQRAQGLFETLVTQADRETLLMLCPLLARLTK